MNESNLNNGVVWGIILNVIVILLMVIFQFVNGCDTKNTQDILNQTEQDIGSVKDKMDLLINATNNVSENLIIIFSEKTSNNVTFISTNIMEENYSQDFDMVNISSFALGDINRSIVCSGKVKCELTENGRNAVAYTVKDIEVSSELQKITGLNMQISCKNIELLGVAYTEDVNIINLTPYTLNMGIPLLDPTITDAYVVLFLESWSPTPENPNLQYLTDLYNCNITYVYDGSNIETARMPYDQSDFKKMVNYLFNAEW